MMRTAMRGLWKPWYVWRPRQLAVRVLREWSGVRPGYHPLPVAWGGPLLADASRAIGHCIWTTGVYDLAVSEVLARVVRRGDTVIDAGANIGYMSVLAALAAGPRGRVLAFEPNPALVPVLTRNVAQRSANAAPIDVYAAALGASEGGAELVLPAALAGNDGIAHIANVADAGTTVSVAMTTIDAALGDAHAALLKLDVEGYEAEVLQGARAALRERRIANVIFEDHEAGAGEVARLLSVAGYSLYAIGWTVRGPRLAPIAEGRRAAPFEAPSYLATLDPAGISARCARPGWITLRNLSARISA